MTDGANRPIQLAEVNDRTVRPWSVPARNRLTAGLNLAGWVFLRYHDDPRDLSRARMTEEPVQGLKPRTAVPRKRPTEAGHKYNQRKVWRY